MKAVLRIFVLAMSCTVGVCQAAPAPQQKSAQNTAKSEQHAAHRRVAPKPSPSSQIVPKPNSAPHAHRSSNASGTAKSMGAQRAGSEPHMAHGQTHKTTGAGAGKTRPARLSAVPRSSMPALSTVRHHNANTAVLGGSKSTRASSAAALNGTRMGARH